MRSREPGVRQPLRAVLAVAVPAALTLAACGSGGDGPGSTGSSGAPSPSTSATSPSTAPPSTPSSSGTPGPSTSGGLQITIPCRSQVLAAQVGPDGADGRQVRITNTGASACSISGFLTVLGIDQGGDRVGGSVQRVAVPATRARIVLGAGQHAYAGLALASGRCVGVAVIPPVDTRPVTAQIVDDAGQRATLSGCPARIGQLTTDASAARL